MHVAVIGYGVIGLTTAIRLLENGYTVTIYCRDQKERTTSDVAGAYWRPSGRGPGDASFERSFIGLHKLKQLSLQVDSGVSLVPFHELYDYEKEFEGWNNIIDDVRVSKFENQIPGIKRSLSFQTALIDTPIYMQYLRKYAARLGVRVEERTFEDINALDIPEMVCINCSGTAARQLCNDESLVPIRGQVVRTERPMGIRSDILYVEHGGEYTYIIPRSEDCILGGTYLEGNSSLKACPETESDIVHRCLAICPQLDEAMVLDSSVGLRPGRHEPRIEKEITSDGRLIVHNYGHGSRGHSLAWGSAEEVQQLVDTISEKVGGSARYAVRA